MLVNGSVNVSAVAETGARMEVWLEKTYENNNIAVGGGVLYMVRPGTTKELSEWLAVEVLSVRRQSM